LSSVGTVARAATELAVEEVNAAGGVNGRILEAVYEDGKCSPSDANSAAQKLLNIDKVSAIIGGLCSSETSAFAPQAMQSKTITITYCSSAPSLTKTGKYFFRTYPVDTFQGKFAAEYGYNTLGARKIAILYHISDWGTGLKDVFTQRFTELGGEIVATEGTPQEARDYRTQLTKLRAAKADYLYTPVYVDGGIAMIGQAKELKITTKILGGDTFDDPKLQKEVSGKADILYTISVVSPSEAFKTKVLAKTGGEQVPICAPNAYDAVKVLSKAIATVGLDADLLEAEIRKTDYTGESGKITFDENGNLTNASYLVKRIENGGATEVKAEMKEEPKAGEAKTEVKAETKTEAERAQ
ncbi:MAG: branched-chain amino acid transport system substrate-binding protein, partial [Parcubacteria group bacterium Greene0416_79]